MNDFKKRFEALQQQTFKYEQDKQEAFKALHLEWGKALEETHPDRAMKQYSLAEDCQWELGTYSTAGGEGLASMSEVYRIKGLRADLLERQQCYGDALEIWEAIAADPNGLGGFTPAAAKIQALKTRLGR
jgi:uncharacterized iron-regulated membrane protein